MLIRDLSRAALASRLRGEGIHLVTGAFTTHLKIEVAALVDEFREMYGDYRIEHPPGIADVQAHIAAPSWLGRYVNRQAQCWADGERMFTPVPLHRAYTLLESVLNWAIAASDVAPLLLHSAILERDGRALLLPATSGSGKSTLCAALVCRGWRLMSDEMTAFDLETGAMLANPRPISLKNQSVGVVAAFAPEAHLTRIYRGTPKGDVAYMRAPRDAIVRADESPTPGLVITPRFSAGAPTRLTPLERTEAFRLLTDNAVNYASMLRTGFDILTALVEQSRGFALTYSNLDEAVATIDRLHHGIDPVERSA